MDKSIKICRENYEVILKKLFPRIATQKFLATRKYHLPEAEVESSLYLSLLTAIERWQEGRGNSTFENFFWTHADCNLKNEIRKEIRRRNPYATEFDIEPCAACKIRLENGTETCELGTCNKLEAFKQKMIAKQKYLEETTEQKLIDQLETEELYKKLFQEVKKKKPQYIKLLDYMETVLQEGVDPNKVVRIIVQKIALEEGKREQTIYNKIVRLAQVVKEVQLQIVETSNKELYKKMNVLNNFIRREGMKLVCVKCGQKKGVTKERLMKLLGKYKDEKTLKEKYLCRDCKASGKTAPSPIPKVNADPEDEE